MADVMDWGSATDEASFTARTSEWAAETVLDLRDAPPPSLINGAPGDTAHHGAFTPGSLGGCSSRSSSSGGAAIDAAEREHGVAPLVDLEALLQALFVEGGMPEDDGTRDREANGETMASPTLRDIRHIGPFSPLHEGAQSALLSGPLYEYGNEDASARAPQVSLAPIAAAPPPLSLPVRAAEVNPGGGSGAAAVPNLTMDWLVRLAQSEAGDGSSVSSRSVPGAHEASALALGGLFSGRSFVVGSSVADSASGLPTARTAVASTVPPSARPVVASDAASHVTVMHHFSEGDNEMEEVVSVFDVSDEPPSARIAAQARAMLGDLAESSGNVSPSGTGLWSSVSETRTNTSARLSSPGSESPRELAEATEVALLNGSLNSMLQRLTFESQLLDDSLTRSVRRVLQMGTVLNGERLSEEEIRALPKVRFHSAEQQHCAICLEAYQEGELLTALRCSHFFHIECVARWMQRATLCPLCRTPCGQE